LLNLFHVLDPRLRGGDKQKKKLSMKKLKEKTYKNFRKKIYNYYKKHGRKLPWRETTNPYHILISEIMLQQTQVDRVIEKYIQFITVFPSVTKLAKAPLAKVLKTWQGLGYNRRALMLHRCANLIAKEHNGNIPDSPALLQKLPGIGKATAASICVYAFNKSFVFIETNIRTVFIHEFYPKRISVSDEELLPLVEKTLDIRNPNKWYSALMDYGTHLKKQFPNPCRKSTHHTIQLKFEGSDRQLRGKILKLLLSQKNLSLIKMRNTLVSDHERLKKILKGLVAEGFIAYKGRKYSINN